MGSRPINRLYKDSKIPKLLMLTKGLSIHNNQYELLVDKLERLLEDRGIKKVDISAVGGPAGLANRFILVLLLQTRIFKQQKK